MPAGCCAGVSVDKENVMSIRSHIPRPVQSRLPYLAIAVAAALGCADAAQAQNIAGAIFTTTSTGQTVNANNYPSKLAVYLNGGPQNCISPGLPAGTYYYMVTNPSGSVLLSQDPVADRKFEVSGGSGGKISINLGNTLTHVNGVSPCGGISIRLAVSASDFADTPNPGGVYKAWITRAADFEAACPSLAKSCELDAFIHSNTKTDNFRVKEDDDTGGGCPINPAECPPPTGELQSFKYYDANVDGVYDLGTDLPLANWPMTMAPPSGPDAATQVTSGSGFVLWTEVEPGPYTVTEGEPDELNWYNTWPSLGAHLDDDTVLTPIWQSATVVAGETAEVEFGNFCLAPSGGHTLGYWSNKNGQARLNDDGGMATEFALLSSYHLVDAAGAPFNPASYTPFRNWLLNGTATNMSYMLSVQLAAMILNIESGIVDGNALYLPYNGTINELVAAAEAALTADGLTLAGDPNRGTQAQLKDWIDALNNNANVVPTTPCAYSFTDPVVVEPTVAPAP
jgi:hypothetical protein